MRRLLNWRVLLAVVCLLVVAAIVWLNYQVDRVTRTAEAGDAYTDGIVNIGRRDYPRAIASFTKALDLGYDKAAALALRAEAQFRLGKPAEALADVDQAIQLGNQEPRTAALRKQIQDALAARPAK